MSVAAQGGRDLPSKSANLVRCPLVPRFLSACLALAIVLLFHAVPSVPNTFSSLLASSTPNTFSLRAIRPPPSAPSFLHLSSFSISLPVPCSLKNSCLLFACLTCPCPTPPSFPTFPFLFFPAFLSHHSSQFLPLPMVLADKEGLPDRGSLHLPDVGPRGDGLRTSGRRGCDVRAPPGAETYLRDPPNKLPVVRKSELRRFCVENDCGGFCWGLRRGEGPQRPGTSG